MEIVFTVCTVELLCRGSSYSCPMYSVTLTMRKEMILKGLLTRCSLTLNGCKSEKVTESTDCDNSVCSLTVILGE